MSTIMQQMIEVANNPANLEVAGEMLSQMPTDSSKIFQGIEKYRGEKFGGDIATYKYGRSSDLPSLVVQGTTEGINSETTIVSDGKVNFITVHSVDDSLTKPIHVNQQVDAWEYVGGRRVALTPEMLFAKTLTKMNASRKISQDLLLWQLLKTGIVPDAKSWAEVIKAGTGTVKTWNNYNFLELWRVARPTGRYPLVDGFSNIDFSVSGGVFDFAEKVQETFYQKTREDTSPLSVNEGAIVLLGQRAWASFIKSPDLKSLAVYTDPQFQALSRMEISGTMIQKVEINGVIFMRKNWTPKLDYQGSTLAFPQMLEKEIFCLPNVDFSIVDLIKFNIKDITSSNVGWAIPRSEFVWSDIADDHTKMDLGMRGTIGYGNKLPEFAMLGTHK